MFGPVSVSAVIPMRERVLSLVTFRPNRTKLDPCSEMAEAPQRPCRFFCHQCLADVSPCLPEYTCPRCKTGFIEELSEENRTDNSGESTSAQTPVASESAAPQPVFTFPPGFGPFTLGIFDDSFDLRMRLGTESSRGSDARRDQEVSAQQPRSSQQQHVLDISRRQGARQDGVPTLEGIIQQLFNGIITPTAMQSIGVGPWGVLHSSPMDYAWGANGLDAVITQLLSQLENHGPPPADRETIENLPTICVTAEHVDAGLECPVCKEDYKADESVRQLPCEHLFHNDCIVPWLEQHDTCPVCRESLTGQNSTRDSADRDFSSSSSSSSSTSASSNDSSPSDENSAGNS